ncbi:hypothetical protein GE061_009377 [Apolygus lucorum]|uniref:Uncharacterized protein n=1 Tax=Apolygus lucorum TaxID=248454 RepID=A0A8S9Y1B9_APOLU|nr:hypothetical protein GE061_009377 [Apolygus lucorum]
MNQRQISKRQPRKLEEHQINGVERVLGVYHQDSHGPNYWVVFHRLGRPSYHPELCVATFSDHNLNSSSVDCLKFLIDPAVNLKKKKPDVSESRMIDGHIAVQKKKIRISKRSGGGGGGGGAGGGGGGGGGGGDEQSQSEKGHNNCWVVFHRLGRPSYHPELCVASFRDHKVDNSSVDCMKFLIDPVVNLGKKKPAISAYRMVHGRVANQKRKPESVYKKRLGKYSTHPEHVSAMKRLAVLLLAIVFFEESFGVGTDISYEPTPDHKTAAEKLEEHQINGVERILGVYHQQSHGLNYWVVFHRLGRPSYHPELCVATFSDHNLNSSSVDCLKFLIDPAVNLKKKKPDVSEARMIDGHIAVPKKKIRISKRSGGGGGGGGAGGGGGGGGGGHYCC